MKSILLQTSGYQKDGVEKQDLIRNLCILFFEFSRSHTGFGKENTVKAALVFETAIIHHIRNFCAGIFQEPLGF